MKFERDILKLFVGNEDNCPNREVFHTPIAQGDYVYASDTYKIIRIPKTLIEGEYTQREKPNCSDVYPDGGSIPCTHSFTQKEFDGAFDKVPLTTKDICPDCKGSCEVDYVFEDYLGGRHYSCSYCPTCNASGYIESHNHKDYTALMSVNGTTYSWVDLNALIQTARYLGVDKIQFALFPYDRWTQLYFHFDNGVEGLISSKSFEEGRKPFIANLETFAL